MKEKRGAEEGAVGLLCFGGDLPHLVAQSAMARGFSVFAIGVRGFATPAIESAPHAWIGLGQIGRFFRLLRARAIRRIVLVGSFTRPSLRDLSFDWKGVRDLPRFAAMLRAGGDDRALRAAVAYLEGHGLAVLGVSDIAPDLLAGEGALGRIAPSREEAENARFGLDLLDAVSPFDLGQACIVLDGRPVAVEGAEGTDGIIARIAELRAAGRLRVDGQRGVLVKAAKRQQDLRLDLPTIGPRTIELAARAQLAGVAVESGKVLIADRGACLALADQLGLFVLGLSRG